MKARIIFKNFDPYIYPIIKSLNLIVIIIDSDHFFICYGILPSLVFSFDKVHLSLRCIDLIIKSKI